MVGNYSLPGNPGMRKGEIGDYKGSKVVSWLVWTIRVSKIRGGGNKDAQKKRKETRKKEKDNRG